METSLEERLKVTKEMFVVPTTNGEYILYAPLQGALMRVNQGVIGFLKRVNAGESPWATDANLTRQLIDSKILVSGSKDLVGNDDCFRQPKSYDPTGVTLLPTYNCNLRCVYCYANAGEALTPNMPIEIAESAIDLIVKNALKTRQKSVSLGFHGGGEPFLPGHKDVVIRSTEYFRRKARLNNLQSSVGAVTNGVMRSDYLDWVVQNFDSLSISLDGTEDIQNRQRPKYSKTRDGASFPEVLSSIKFLEERKFKYGVRATITSETVGRMSEIVDFFASICPSVSSYHLEPLFECGRCKTTKELAPTEEAFLINLIEAQKTAKALGKSVYYSGGSLEKISDHFCGAAGSNFFVTPLGDVTTCLEVCRAEDPRSQIFYIGKYNPQTKKFEFDQNKLANLKNRKVGNMPYCADCFAKFNCAGDCLAKSFSQTNSLLCNEGNSRCRINQGILLNEMIVKLATKPQQNLKTETASKEHE